MAKNREKKVYVTPDQETRIKDYAEKVGKDVSSFMREAALEKIQATGETPATTTESPSATPPPSQYPRRPSPVLDPSRAVRLPMWFYKASSKDPYLWERAEAGFRGLMRLAEDVDVRKQPWKRDFELYVRDLVFGPDALTGPEMLRSLENGGSSVTVALSRGREAARST